LISLYGKILLCSNGLIEHSKNGTKEITDSCDAISCNRRECLIASNGTLYIYNGKLRTLEITNNAQNIEFKIGVVGILLVFLMVWLLREGKSS